MTNRDPPDTSRPMPRVIWSAATGAGDPAPGPRIVPEETPVAFSYDGVGHAVMMATPRDLEDFAIGFSLTEGIINAIDQIAGIAAVPVDTGIHLRIALAGPQSRALVDRRRFLAGPLGCGLCGLENLDEAVRAPPTLPATAPIPGQAVIAALAALDAAQALHRATRAAHAAGFHVPGRGLVCLREDVGRHNALDKLGGALAHAGQDPAAGLAVVTSRLSVDLVQKAATLGIPILAAVSVPTALAIRVAAAAGMTLIGIARPDGFEIFSEPGRIV